MRPAIELRHQIDTQQTTLGILITNHLWLEVIELAAEAGLDYVIVDLEHMGHSRERVAEACQLGRLTHFPVLLRPASTETDVVRIAMDLGPCGLLLPMVESARQLDAVRDGVYMPPRGKRRPGGPGNRWVKQFSYETFKNEVEDHIIIIPQIESVEGVSNAREIAAHPLVTSLGVGPFDLSASLGVCWKPHHPSFKQAISTLRTAADEAGKCMWMVGEPESLLREGFHFLCVGEPMAVLQSSLAALVKRLRTEPQTNGAHVTRTVNQTLYPATSKS